MEELPTDIQMVDAVDKERLFGLLERIEKLASAAPAIEVLSVVRDSLADIRNILDVQNQRLDSVGSLEAKLKTVGDMFERSEELYTAVDTASGRLDSALGAFREKTEAIRNATDTMEIKAAGLGEIAEGMAALSQAVHARNTSIASLMEEFSKMLWSMEEKFAGIASVAEKYSESREDIRSSVSGLDSIRQSLGDLRNDVFERNQYLSIMLSDMNISKEAMEKNIALLESSSTGLKETVVQMDRRTDDILNVTMSRIEDLKKLRDVLYDDIDAVDKRVRKVQKSIDTHKKDSKKASKRQTAALELIKKISKKADRIEKLARKKQRDTAGRKPGLF